MESRSHAKKSDLEWQRTQSHCPRAYSGNTPLPGRGHGLIRYMCHFKKSLLFVRQSGGSSQLSEPRSLLSACLGTSISFPFKGRERVLHFLLLHSLPLPLPAPSPLSFSPSPLYLLSLHTCSVSISVSPPFLCLSTEVCVCLIIGRRNLFFFFCSLRFK